MDFCMTLLEGIQLWSQGLLLLDHKWLFKGSLHKQGGGWNLRIAGDACLWFHQRLLVIVGVPDSS
jgi:hypothetical protein